MGTTAMNENLPGKYPEILVVQSERLDNELEERLRSLGYSVWDTVSIESGAPEITETEQPDLIVLDYGFHDFAIGYEMADLIFFRYGLPLVLVIRSYEQDQLDEVIQHGPYGILLHPFRDMDLKIGIETALKMFRLNEKAISAETTSRDSESLYWSLFENAKDAILLMEGDRFITGNPASFRLFQCEADHILNRPPWDFSPETQPDGSNSKESALKRIQAAYAGDSQRFEWRHLLGNGTEIDCEIMLTPVELSNKRYLSIILHDITERKRVEENLRESESIYQRVFERTVYGLVIADINGVFVNCNSQYEKLTGYTRDELRHMDVRTITPEKWHDLEKKIVAEELTKKGFTKSYEKEYIRKDKTVIPIEITLHRLTFQGHRSPIYWAMVQDITQRKLSEIQMEKELEFRHTLLQASPAYFSALDVDGKVMMLNDALLMALGYRLEEVIGKHFSTTFTLPEDRPEWDEVFQKIRRGEQVNDIETRVVTRDGQPLVVAWNGRRVIGLDGRTESFYGVGIDITERKKAEKIIRESEKKYRGFYESAPVGIFRSTLSGIMLDANPYMVRMLNYDSAEELLTTVNEVGLGNSLYVKRETRPRMLNEILNRSDWYSYETDLLRKDGCHITCSVKIRVHDLTVDDAILEGFIEDVTERRKAEREKRKLEDLLVQSQKMESIGTLAGGIAHDLNNILSPIIAFTELAKMNVTAGDQADRHLEEVLRAGLRARELVKHILTFSRQSDIEKKAIQLSPLVKEAVKFLRASLPATIELNLDNDIPDSLVWADPSQIHQVVMNLCTNSAQAMKETGGTIHIQMTEVTIGDDDLLPYLELKHGPYIKMIFADTGPGIPKDIINRIFDPFYTTKERGEGTGLGLSVVHGIVKGMGGAISVYSEPGEGTVFQVFLPECARNSEGLHPQIYELTRGKGRILFVDDEERIIMAGLMVLEKLGYDVMTATRGAEALHIFKENPAAFDLVITDMTMPKMTGIELAGHLTEIRPDIPILLCTGLSDMITSKSMTEIGIQGVIMKPMIVRELAEAIERALNRELLSSENDSVLKGG